MQDQTHPTGSSAVGLSWDTSRAAALMFWQEGGMMGPKSFGFYKMYSF